MNLSPSLITATRSPLFDVTTENVVAATGVGVGLGGLGVAVAAVGVGDVGVGNSKTFLLTRRFLAWLDRSSTGTGPVLTAALSSVGESNVVNGGAEVGRAPYTHEARQGTVKKFLYPTYVAENQRENRFATRIRRFSGLCV